MGSILPAKIKPYLEDHTHTHVCVCTYAFHLIHIRVCPLIGIMDYGAVYVFCFPPFLLLARLLA